MSDEIQSVLCIDKESKIKNAANYTTQIAGEANIALELSLYFTGNYL